MSFFIMSRPFFDFAVIESTGANLHNAEEKLSKDLGAVVTRMHKNSIILSYENAVPRVTDNLVTLMSGYASINGTLHYDNPPISDDLASDLSTATGKFSLALFHPAKGYRFATDLFGQGSLFYYQDTDLYIVSNRVHLIIECLRRIGKRIEIDYDKLLFQSYFDIYIFNAYCSSKSLFIKGVNQLGVDEELTAADGKLTINKKGFYKTTVDVSKEDYEHYLTQGAAELVSFFSSVRRSGLFDQYLIDISGGKDSRVILAAMIASGIDPKQVLSQTYATHSVLDDKIGIALTEYFGFTPTHTSQTYSPRIPVALTDHLEAFASFFMGTYYLFNAGGLSSFGRPSRIARFAGTSSNVLRSGSSGTLQNRFPHLVNENSTAFFSKLMSHFGSEKLFPKAAVSRVGRILQNEIESLSGTTVPDKLEAIHHNYGARYHGGQASIFQSWIYGPVFNPILTPNLYRAARSLPVQDRVNATLFYDIVKRLVPELACFNYDKPFPYADSAIARSSNKRIIDSTYNTDPYYAQVKKIKQAYRYSFLAGRKFGFTLNDLSIHYQTEFPEVWDRLVRGDAAGSGYFSDELGKSIMNGLKSNTSVAHRRALLLLTAYRAQGQ